MGAALDSHLYSELREILLEREVSSAEWDAYVRKFLSKLEDRVESLAGQKRKLQVCQWGRPVSDSDFVAHEYETTDSGFRFALQVSIYGKKGDVLFRQPFDYEVEIVGEDLRMSLNKHVQVIPRAELLDEGHLDDIAAALGVAVKNAVVPQGSSTEV